MHTPEITPLKQQNIKPKANILIKGNLFKRDSYFIENNINFRSGSQNRSGFKLALWTWMSAFIDTLILTSMSCFGIVVFSFIVKSGVLNIEPSLKEMFLISFITSAWIYLITMRIFMGASLGEWSCGLRLGQPAQRIKANYVLKVVVRTTFILITGIITIPLLSLIFKTDLAGDLTDVYIYSLK